MTWPVLIVSDAVACRSTLRQALENGGFAATVCATRAAFEQAMLTQTFLLHVIDLPEDQGLELVGDVRRGPAGAGFPIITLVNDGNVSSRVRALRAGASDCVAKPFNPAHLAARAAALMQGPRARLSKDPSGPGRLLVVDDSATYGSAFAEELRRDGHEVILAVNAAEALELLALQRVDGVLLDVFMPDVNGIELCRRIRGRAATASVPILMLTGRKDSVLRDTALTAGADDFVVKTTDFPALRARVAELLRNAAARPVERSGAPIRPATSSAFLDRIVAASGLSTLVGRSSVLRACERAGVAPHELTPVNLARVLPHLESTLRVFVAATEVQTRMRSISALGHAEPPARS
ncbi:response regulator [Minicystis rosea]|nr:response regulator [Minicystis rosea]